MTYYLTDGGHVLISGATGSRPDYGGKTVIMSWWVQHLVAAGEVEAGVMVNPKGHGWLGKGPGPETVTVSTISELGEAWDRGARCFDFRLDRSRAEDHHAELVAILLKLPGKKVIGHDEAHNYAGGKSFEDCLAEYGNLDQGSMKSLVVTQRPWNLGEDHLGNLPVKIWVGPITGEGRRFFKSWEMAHVMDQLDDHPDAGRPYWWIVTDASELQEVNPPVAAEFAPS